MTTLGKYEQTQSANTINAEKSLTVVFLGTTSVVKERWIIAMADKVKMAEKIFANTYVLDAVNKLIHPAVEEYILKEMQTERKKQVIDVFFLEAALLIEAGYIPYMDELWYIYVDEQTRRLRLKESRAYSDEKIDAIMSSQLSEEVFQKECQIVIDNCGKFEDTCYQIDNVMKQR